MPKLLLGAFTPETFLVKFSGVFLYKWVQFVGTRNALQLSGRHFLEVPSALELLSTAYYDKGVIRT